MAELAVIASLLCLRPPPTKLPFPDRLTDAFFNKHVCKVAGTLRDPLSRTESQVTYRDFRDLKHHILKDIGAVSTLTDLDVPDVDLATNIKEDLQRSEIYWEKKENGYIHVNFSHFIAPILLSPEIWSSDDPRPETRESPSFNNILQVCPPPPYIDAYIDGRTMHEGHENYICFLYLLPAATVCIVNACKATSILNGKPQFPIECVGVQALRVPLELGVSQTDTLHDVPEFDIVNSCMLFFYRGGRDSAGAHTPLHADQVEACTLVAAGVLNGRGMHKFKGSPV